MYDIVIRGGRIADGSGSALYSSDIAIKDGLIFEIGQVSAPARQVIDADGALVTPGFVDIHAHYDGQLMWDTQLEPSFSHGVTTAVAGNCGVGFAPARPDFRRELIEVMEGVEEIPGIVLDEGLDWNWRSFPDYLDRLSQRSYTMDVACMVPHAPLRVFVMGERAIRHETATADDIATMSLLLGEAMDAGAIGFSAGRLAEHRTSTGAHVPGTFAKDDELFALARAVGRSGHGVVQVVPLGAIGNVMAASEGCEVRRAEHERFVRIAQACGRPVTYSITDFASDPDDARMMVALSDKAAESGINIRPQIAARGIGSLMMLDGYHPFMLRPSYQKVAELPRTERAQAMRHPALRAAILAEQDDTRNATEAFVGLMQRLQTRSGDAFPFTLPLDYEPPRERSIEVLAQRANQSTLEWLFDFLVEADGGNVVVNFNLNYVKGDLDSIHDMLLNNNVLSGLADGGAHMKLICDASLTTFQLTFWARDRVRGPKLPLEYVVKKMTSDGARFYGLHDRGVIAVGKRADINVIDHQNLAVSKPVMAFDLPLGSPRILQGASGYLATLVGGSITRRHDTETGARPGRLIRSRATNKNF